MPSNFRFRQHIRKLFHHPSNKSGKSNSREASALGAITTSSHSQDNPILPLQYRGLNEPFELHHSFPQPEISDLTRTTTQQSQLEGEPLGAGLHDVFYPPTISTIQSIVPSPEPSETDLDHLDTLGPRPLQKEEAQPQEHLVHPGLLIPSTPIGEDPPPLSHSAFSGQSPQELPKEGYFAQQTIARRKSLDLRRTRTTDSSDIPPEAINVLPEPPKLERVYSNKSAFALENARLRKLKSRGQESPSAETSIQIGDIQDKGHSSLDSGSVYSAKSRSESRKSSRIHFINSHERGYTDSPAIGGSGLAPNESPVLGWQHFSEYSAMVDPFVLNNSEEGLDSHMEDAPSNVDSEYQDRRYTLGPQSQRRFDRHDPTYDPAEAQLRREEYAEPDVFMDCPTERTNGQQGYVNSFDTQSVPVPQHVELPGQYHHDAEIYHTHVPSISSTTQTHVSFNSPVIHEHTTSHEHEIQHAHITRDIHTYDILPTIQPIVRSEYLPTKHVVQLENGETRDISAEEAGSGDYRILMTENRVVAPASVMNVQEFADKMRELERNGSGGGSEGRIEEYDKETVARRS